MEKSKKITGVAFVAIIMLFMLSIVFRFAVRDYVDVWFDWMKPIASEENQNTDDEKNWETEYPFEDTADFDFSEEKAQQSQEDNTFVQMIDNIKYEINYYTTNLLIGRIKFVEANARLNKLFGNKIITANESVTLMKNGYLTFVKDEQDTTYEAKSLEWLNDKMNEKCIDFMYVQYPAKESVTDNQLPYGVDDNNNANITDLLEKLKKTDVKVLDFRSLLESKGGNYYENFFKTDHHWKPETGVWASGKIVEALNQNFGYGFDESIGNIENYNVKVYEGYCFGSQGKIATLSFAEPEDISMIYPKNETDYTVIYDEETEKEGTYKQTMLDESAFDKKDFYSVSTYSTYLYGGSAVINIKNNMLDNGKRLVFVTDSFGNCVAPCLSQVYEYVDVIDLRHFNGSLMNYISKNKPDTLLVGCNSSVFSSEDSHNSMFNYE